MRTQLLCTFTRQARLTETIDVIVSCNDILFDKIYVFSNQEDTTQLMCTYNIEFTDNFEENIENTISLHRKKQSNSLYTINALNELVKKLNNGVLDNSFPIPWENYRNRMLLTNEEGLYEIPTRVYSIIHTKTWKSDIEEK